MTREDCIKLAILIEDKLDILSGRISLNTEVLEIASLVASLIDGLKEQKE